ncbi:uncharacterized protein MELLADRAFT_124134 [Melampsora larici-populina 98AG31]|uniref:Secreted protein n=1 Tax=Melampsora larici-populina (strain 98AG31 / pathotype 3-4-7) TaxID=747676 RepID=F4RU22_MELLP|nr:uncharacterized protein MELLADRAFT_124134 [Melampsora larici-populina 98AG31]EGG04100.1 secreted protein [Melampsora larici-populina 98AG31]
MASKLLQVFVFAIMISTGLCTISRQTCNGGYTTGTNSDHICQVLRGGNYKCPMSSCSLGGEMKGCTADPGQHAPALSASQVLKCQEFYSTTADGQIHCRSQYPYHYIVKCKTWQPVVCNNCEQV